MNFIGILAGFVQVLYIAALIAGVVICVRQKKFMAGFYFFLILLVIDISKYFYTPIINHWITNGQTLGGLTIGETSVMISIIINLLKVAAFIILVVGLYRKWKGTTNRAQA